ncbi:argininosuccinate lyase [Aeromonas enteropelogenes]|uniref:argininosuccinate lyase n=1 Tax=Aeromonas enteropelogenes TaxID=29489 RepID=UPI0038D1E320
MNDYEKLWGGRFSKEIDKEVLDYTFTTNIDQRLIRFDIWGSMAHVLMLNRQKIITNKAASLLAKTLFSLYQQQKKGTLKLKPEFEDVHLNIEHMIICDIGYEDGGQLHTARSRNDQVVTDTRMYLRDELLNIQSSLLAFVGSLIKLSRKNLDKLAIGYTHLQPAQPITLAFWYSAYASIFMRDLQRLSEAYLNVNYNVLGACALAGTSFPIDREQTKNYLGFDHLLEHSLDATSSRDFVIQSLFAFVQLMSNFSKMAEEIVVWSSFEFDLIKVDEAFTTGSSIMPQKKNPVVAELMKGRSGRLIGALVQMLTVTKGITLGYNCDLQEDKYQLWEAIDTIKSTTSIAHRQLLTSHYNSVQAEELSWLNFSTATELANLLVIKKQRSFRQAHHLIGELIKSLVERENDLRNIEYVQLFLTKHSVEVTEDEIRSCVDPKQVVMRQTSVGATSKPSVTAMLDRLSNKYYKYENLFQVQREKLLRAEASTLNNIQELANKIRVPDI